MLFAIDIDGTLARKTMRRFAEKRNRTFNLRMNSEEFEHTSYDEFSRQ